jgi:hypothetical protein
MSRHAVRCLILWLVALPLVLAGTMRPIACAAWVYVTSYIFVGIEEVGVQVGAAASGDAALERERKHPAACNPVPPAP